MSDVKSIRYFGGHPVQDPVAQQQYSDENLSRVIGEYISTNLRDDLDQIETLKSNLESLSNKVDTVEENVNFIANTINGVHNNILDDIKNRIPHAANLDEYFNILRTGKVYQTKEWLYSANPTSTCIKQLDNEGLVCQPSTDTVEGRDDYADIPLFDWWYCNYVKDVNGDPIVTAVKGADEDYREDGSIDVGVVQMSFYWNVEKKDTHKLWTISDKPNATYGLQEYPNATRSNGTYASYIVHAAFASAEGANGKLTSYPNAKIVNYQSYSNMLTNYAKKGAGYKSGGIERNTFVILMAMIKYATKHFQSIFAGCTNYNYQYSAAIIRTTKEKFFPLVDSNAANIVVGSNVSVGYSSISGGALSMDRDGANMHKYANQATVTRIETIDANTKAIYLDELTEGFDTNPVTLDSPSGPKTAFITLSTMGWNTGSTMNVLGKHDGSRVSNTNGKYVGRIQGLEYLPGYYAVAGDTVMVFKSDYSKDVYVAYKYSNRSTDEAVIKGGNFYKLIGNIPALPDGADFYIGDVDIDVETGGWFPSTISASGSQGTQDIVYSGSTSISGTREYLQGGSLGLGSFAGSSCLACWLGLATAYWNYCGFDL